MDNQNTSQHGTAYLLLIISTLFVCLDGLELYRLTNQWDQTKSDSDLKIFNDCVKYPLITKTGFTIFSFLAAFSCFLVSLLLCFCVELFVEKLSRAYIKMVYSIFGPYMLTIGLLALYHWDVVLYHCGSDNSAKIFSFSNLFNITSCVLLSLIITLAMVIYECSNLYIDSIRQRDEGSYLLRKIFWGAVIRYR